MQSEARYRLCCDLIPSDFFAPVFLAYVLGLLHDLLNAKHLARIQIESALILLVFVRGTIAVA